jgi:hypothetical protein
LKPIRKCWDIQVVHEVLRLLHVTEFMVLVEYTEVIIMIVYCLYLLITVNFPNRQYYAQLSNMDAEAMQYTLSSILLYALLEVVSLVLLAMALEKQRVVSSLHQLAFVLEHQWHMMQAKLNLWVTFAT